MFIEKSLKKFNSALKNSPAVLTWLMVFCVFSGLIRFQTPQYAASNGLVFCPLQKTWVKSYTPSETPIKNRPFDEVCATTARKNFLQIEISLKTSHPVTERIIFDYLKKGNEIFAQLNRLPDSPQSQIIRPTTSEKAANSFSLDFDKPELANSTLPQSARPPTFSNASIRFGFLFARTLEQISRNINPRSPPLPPIFS